MGMITVPNAESCWDQITCKMLRTLVNGQIILVIIVPAVCHGMGLNIVLGLEAWRKIFLSTLFFPNF